MLPRVRIALATRALLGTALLLGAGAPGCGYQLLRYPAASAGEPARRVAIQTLRNDSLDPGYEFVVGDALRTEFARRGGLRLVDDPAAADLVVSGRVLPISTRRGSFSSVVLTVEYEVTVSLDLEVSQRGADGKPHDVPLDQRALTERELYLASADIEVTRKNREEALRRLAGLLAGRVHDALYEVGLP